MYNVKFIVFFYFFDRKTSLIIFLFPNTDILIPCIIPRDLTPISIIYIEKNHWNKQFILIMAAILENSQKILSPYSFVRQTSKIRFRHVWTTQETFTLFPNGNGDPHFSDLSVYKCLYLISHDYYRQPCVATQPIMFYVGLFFIYFFFIHRSFSETTRPIHTKFSGIVYSSVIWIIR